MIQLKFISLCLILVQLNVQSLNLNKVRDLYRDAANDKTQVASFYELLSDVTLKDGTALNAYKCAATMLTARHAKTIKAKKDGFKKGATNLEAIIANDPNNIESRFIRLSIQENSPKILKYNTNIEEDKLLIIKQFSNIKSKTLQKHIKDYVLESKSFSDEEKALILDL